MSALDFRDALARFERTHDARHVVLLGMLGVVDFDGLDDATTVGEKVRHDA